MIKAHEKNIKNLILFGKITSNNANYYGTNIMSKVKAPLFSYKTPVIYYQSSFSKSLKHFSMMNETSYDDSNDIWGSKFNNLSENKIAIFKLKLKPEDGERKLATHLAVHPNYAVARYPNLSPKKNLSNIGYKISDKNIVYSDQCLGVGHPFLHKKEVEII